jgi:hypothetical protein
MRTSFAGVPENTQFAGTVERGAQSETFSIPKAGLRPFWDLSATVGAGDQNVFRSRGQPIVSRAQHVTNLAGTDRAYLSGLNNFAVRADSFWNGGTADVYVVISGERSLLTSGTITATKVNLASLVTGTNQMVTATRWEGRLDSFNRPSVGYWYRVAAINASGEIGTYSAWVQYTAPASIGTSTATNPTLTSITHSVTPGALSAPTGVAVAAKSGDTATAEVTWSAVGGASGYVVQFSWQDPTLNTSPEYVDLDTSGVSIPAGAVVILSKTFTTQTTTWCSRVWGTFEATLGALGEPTITNIEWVAYTGGDPAPPSVYGTHFWRRTLSGSGNLFAGGGDGYVVHAGQRQSFYKVLEANKDYKARFLMRADAPIAATFAIGGVTTGGSTVFNLTTSWQTFEVTFSRTSVLDDATNYFMSMTVPSAATVDIARYEIFENDLSVDDFSSDIKSRTAPNLYLRDHGLIKPGANTVSMRQALSPVGQSARGATAQNILRKAHINGGLPWIQLEWHLSEPEWEDFVAYMAAPVASGHPMALMRAAQGQTTPWVDVFPQIIVEFGNEAWNTIAGFWQTVSTPFTDQVTLATLTTGATYGAHAQGCINAMKQSPWWRQFRAKTMFYGSGQDGNSAVETDMVNIAPDLDGTGYAPYNRGFEASDDGYNLGDNGTNFKAVLAYEASSSTRQTRHDNINTGGASAMVYEANLNYDVGDAFAREVVLKSRAAGTAHLAGVCIRAASGLAVENYFTLASGSNWTSHARHYQGGGTYMSWGLLKLIWEAVGRSSVRKIALVAPPLDGSVELLQAFEFKSVADPSNRVIVAVNRDINVSLLDVADPLYNSTPSGTYACSIPTSIASCSGLSYYANVGNFRQHNRYIPGFRQTSASSGQQNVADSLCVAFTYNWTTGTPLGDADPIDIDDTYGAAAGGLAAGNCVLLHLTGCVDA